MRTDEDVEGWEVQGDRGGEGKERKKFKSKECCCVEQQDSKSKNRLYLSISKV